MRRDGEAIMERDVGLRLLLALALSSAVHLSLIYGIAVGPSHRVPGSVIVAQLVSQAVAPLIEPRPSEVSRRRSAPVAAAFVPAAHEPASVAVAEPATPPAQAAAAYARVDDRNLPSAEVPLLVDPVWYEAKDLDLYPRPLTPVEPEYPASAAAVLGEVTLLLQIDEYGAVNQLSVLAAEPPGYFEEPAAQAFQTARFAPAQREGRPVRSRIVVKVRFAPQTP
jgi:periplasmic protein TonB